MRAVVSAFLNNPVVFLASLQAGVTAAAVEGVIPAWVAFVSLAIVTGLQRSLVYPKGRL